MTSTLLLLRLRCYFSHHSEIPIENLKGTPGRRGDPARTTGDHKIDPSQSRVWGQHSTLGSARRIDFAVYSWLTHSLSLIKVAVRGGEIACKSVAAERILRPSIRRCKEHYESEYILYLNN